MSVSVLSFRDARNMLRLLAQWLTTSLADLAGHFVNWVSSAEGEFLKGKYLWVNWDVDELKARKEELRAPRKLLTGLVGWAL